MPDTDTLVDLSGIRELFGLPHRQAAHKLTGRDGFPPPEPGRVNLTGRRGPPGRVWSRAAVLVWKGMRDAERSVRAARVGSPTA